MKYRLRHRTTYAYENAVSFARCVLRLTPRSSATQTVTESAITVTPEPSARLTRIGPFGAEIVTVTVDKPHKALVIEANSRIDVHVPPPGDPDASQPWEAVRSRALNTADLSPDGPASYLFATPRTPILPSITDYVRISFPPGRPIIAAVSELNNRINREFKYDPGATEVSTPVAQAFDARHGVCQDFAQIMIVGLRGLGLPVKYVSGYLRTIPPPGQARLEGADATHAWVAVWCGDETGWVGFDPTNAILAGNDHLVLAIGRDYADVAPIDGVILASGVQTLKVEVDVIPEDEPTPAHA
ncbi:MAG: transglutaminase family protein [Alphaproteobacteria bacterium]|nr:transglutaminase family protein [Alphaproteobacteria bacterium]MBU1516045.1 transglutaminase family protein [Alphaproteobacteria bacterium]MBU2092740.1 transglutaminase family protein [Alphaproteobacteria bacterium]MBU2153735.1 transglutaminase family protein [Alphaproteobacteria bacterium]MBU2308363.1 transglutaminase family protein [Alphaproteobacteria bacterium]